MITAPESGYQHTREEIQNLYKEQSMGNTLHENLLRSVLEEYLHLQSENTNTYFYTVDVFQVASLLYELKDENLTRQFSSLLPSVLSIIGNVLPNDVLPFCELIRARQLGLKIHLNNLSFHKNSHLLFFKEMESITADFSYIKVKMYFFLQILKKLIDMFS